MNATKGSIWRRVKKQEAIEALAEEALKAQWRRLF
jgi:hypothetical protein